VVVGEQCAANVGPGAVDVVGEMRFFGIDAKVNRDGIVISPAAQPGRAEVGRRRFADWVDRRTLW
jgi:hypothetical protein